MNIKQIKTEEDYISELLLSKEKLVIVKFTASWCIPCKKNESKILELANLYKNKVFFIKVDVDESEDIIKKYKITSIPTFYFYKNNEKINEIIGLDEPRLENYIIKFL